MPQSTPEGACVAEPIDLEDAAASAPSDRVATFDVDVAKNSCGGNRRQLAHRCGEIRDI
jgi:hypothetical protein